MENLLPLVTLVSIHLLALVSPGPNFFVSVKQGLSYPRSNQIATTAGIATGTLSYTLLGFLGVSAIIAQSVVVYSTIKLLGALYLIYLGIQAFRSKSKAVDIDDVTQVASEQSQFGAYRLGFLTCVSNPKAAIYFFTIFTTVLSPDTSTFIKVIVVILLPLLSWTWYTLVASFFSLRQFRQLYARFQRGVNLAFGTIMITLGVGIILRQD